MHKQCVCTRSLRRNWVNTKYVQEKGYWELLVLRSMLFVHFYYITKNLIIVLRLAWNPSVGFFLPLSVTVVFWLNPINLTTHVTHNSVALNFYLHPLHGVRYKYSFKIVIKQPSLSHCCLLSRSGVGERKVLNPVY